MIRLVYQQIQTAEGSTDAEAEQAAASLEDVAGLDVLSERTVANPRQTIAALGASVEEARAEVRRLTPAGAQIIADKVLSNSDRLEFVVHAWDEPSAIARARELCGPPASVSLQATAGEQPAELSLVEIESAKIWEAGRKGFLGFGAKQSRYEVVLTRKACVERIWFRGWKCIRTVGVEIKSAATLQRCASSDNLTPDRDFEQGTRELAAEGAIGSLGLAKLIDACRESRSAAILWALLAARDAEPTEALIEALEAVLDAKQKARIADVQLWLPPEQFGQREIAWSDRTFRKIETVGGESLDALRQKIAVKGGGAALPGVVAIV